MTTSVLIFRKGGTTDSVMFLRAENDGYRLDANHDSPIAEDDLPLLVQLFKQRDECWQRWTARDQAAEWQEKWWFADAAALRAKDFNLSAGEHGPVNQSQIEHRDPRELLDELAAIENEIAKEIGALKSLLREAVA